MQVMIDLSLTSKGNDYRLVAMILFAAKKVFIRWIGTHKEYDNKDCSNA